jgi:hypothetical protein
MSTGLALLDGLLASILGNQASFALLDARASKNELAVALQVAEELIGAPRRAVWVTNGPGAMFSLPQPEPGTAVVSDRAIEYTSRIREVLLSHAPVDRLAQTAHQAFLTIASEEALLQGHAELAIKALAVSVVDGPPSSVPIDESATHYQEASPLGSLATRCFGLLHELGHLAPSEDYGHLASDDAIMRSLDWALRNWLLQAETLGDAWERARARPQSSVIGVEHLASEVWADLFATDALLRAAARMQSRPGEPLEWGDFIREAHAAQQAVVVFDRIRRAVALGSSPAPTRDNAIEMALQPVSIAVRNLAQQEFVVSELMVEIAVEGRTSDTVDLNRERRFVHDSLRPLEASYRVLDATLDKAIDFVLTRHRQADSHVLQERLATAVRSSKEAARLVERFLVVADGLGHSASTTLALRSIIEHP